MGAFELRAGTADDHAFLAEMLAEAVHWRPDAERPEPEEVLRRPELSRYLASWGREGDRALLAVHGDEPVGAAWFRLFSAEEPGYGFVDATVPELGMAVAAPARRLGIGRALLSALVVQAQLDDHLALSLSVDDDNPARALYTELGFEPVDAGERDDGFSTMLLRFALR